MVVAPINHVSLDERGIAYVTGSSVKVADIAIDAYTWKLTPNQIQENYPHLSLAEIYAALAYYHDHQSAIDRQIGDSDREYEQARTNAPNPLTRADFEARRSSASTAHPSETDWQRVDAMTDEEIDTANVPPLTEDFFRRAILRVPERASEDV